MATAMERELFNLPCNHLNGSQGVTQKIKNAMQETAKQFVYIGFLLWEVKEYEYYYENEYESVYEYAEKELGFRRSSTKNFIAICNEFCRRDNQWTKCPTMFLDDRWNDYQYSQLCEMLSMNATQREQTKPNMTVKQLRELKKQPAKQVPKEELREITSGQTSGQQSEEQSCVINNYWGELKEEEVRELCFMTGTKYNKRSCYKIQITPIPKTKKDIKSKLCKVANINYDPENYNYGITVEIKKEN